MGTLVVLFVVILRSLWLSFGVFVMTTRGSKERANTSVGKRNSLTCSNAGCLESPLWLASLPWRS